MKPQEMKSDVKYRILTEISPLHYVVSEVRHISRLEGLEAQYDSVWFPGVTHLGFFPYADIIDVEEF